LPAQPPIALKEQTAIFMPSLSARFHAQRVPYNNQPTPAIMLPVSLWPTDPDIQIAGCTALANATTEPCDLAIKEQINQVNIGFFNIGANAEHYFPDDQNLLLLVSIVLTNLEY